MTPIYSALFVLWALGAEAADTTVSEPAPQEAPTQASGTKPRPPLDLDRLLRIPPGGVAAPDLRGGKDRSTWQSEFAEAHAEVEELERRITETQAKLRETAPDDWSFTPSGAGVPSDPEILALRASLRRDRQSLDAARQRLRELEVEASLAGVPDSWRQVSEETP
jgi:hypothetical protein